MEKIVINKLGPIKHCTLEINDFMVFTGPQASGKSTIAKKYFFSLRISKNLLLMQINKKLFGESDTIKLTIKNRLIKRSTCQIFYRLLGQRGVWIMICSWNIITRTLFI